MYRLVVADLDSPSYFVATAAVELGFFREEGIDAEVERAYGALNGPERLRNGEVHFLGGPAYMATRAFPGWKGVKLLCALAQYSYWFLAVRADLDVRRGDVEALKGLRISSSTAFPEVGLRHLLKQGGIDLERDKVSIVPLPNTKDEHLKYRVGVDALGQNIADAYWGNGMRLAIGEKLGVAKVHLDLRRGDGPSGARFYNFRGPDHDRAADRGASGRGCGRSAGDRQGAAGAQGRSVARDANRRTSLRFGSRFTDRRPGCAGCAILRRYDFTGGRRRHQQVRHGQWAAQRTAAVRSAGGIAILGF